jgi:hypothetical protein
MKSRKVYNPACVLAGLYYSHEEILATMQNINMNLEGVAEPARPGTETLAAALSETLGQTWTGLTVFGSAVTTEFGSRNRIRSVAIVRSVDVQALARLGEKGTKLGNQRVEAPLIVTPEYVAESLDAFPVEFLEIQQVHHAVLGEDLFQELQFHEEHMRLQCEREFKRMLIRLRQGVLASQGKAGQLGALLDDLSSHAVRVLRGVLWCKGDCRPLPPRDVLEAARRALDLDLTALIRPADGSHPASPETIEQTYAVLSALTERVDAM